MQMYAIRSLIIWVCISTASEHCWCFSGSPTAKHNLWGTLPQLSLLTITNAILCVSWSCFAVTQISTNRLSHAHGGWCTIQHTIPLPRHLVRLRWFMVLLTRIANGPEAATSSQSRRRGPLYHPGCHFWIQQVLWPRNMEICMSNDRTCTSFKQPGLFLWLELGWCWVVCASHKLSIFR